MSDETKTGERRPPPVQIQGPEDVEERVARARKAQAIWRRYSLSQRVYCLRKLWESLRKDEKSIVSIIQSETGKPRFDIECVEIAGTEMLLKFFTRSAHRILQDRAVPRPWLLFNKRSYIRYVPRGVIGLITPWNFPFLIPMGDAIAALLAGNAVLLKPSEWTSKIAHHIADRVTAAGLFPDGLFQVVEGDGTTGSAVVERVDMVLFTGSTRAGREVSKAAAPRMIPVVLELGGNHPMIVAGDADLERAAKAAVWGRFSNCGQVCVGVERVFVERPAYERFTTLLKAEVQALRQGISGGYDTDVGRLILPGQLAVVERHLEDARAKGGRVSGGEVVDRENLVVTPALVLDAHPEMLLMQEETFGPVLPVMPVHRVEDAVRIANAGSHGLAASVWTSDVAKGEAWSSLIEAGMVSVNDLLTHYMVASLPFGGMKRSGLWRRHSEEGLRMFCQPQSVIVHEWPSAPELWWFPYTELKARILKLLSRFS